LLPVKTPTSIYVPGVALVEVPAKTLIASNPVNVPLAYVPAQLSCTPARILEAVNPLGLVGAAITSPPISATVIVKLSPTVLVTPVGDTDLSSTT